VIVLDASVAVEIVLNTEYGRVALDRVEFEPEVHVPEHFHIETISALRGGVLRKEVSEARAVRSLASLEQLRVVRFPVLELSDAVWELHHQLTAYDAAYLALARRIDAQLLTIDSSLAAAARAEGRLVEFAT
jgi:predicted nucleic acid-binding protein